MSKARFATTNRGFTLLSVLFLSACSGAPADGAGTNPPPSETPLGAQVPSAPSAPSAPGTTPAPTAGTPSAPSAPPASTGTAPPASTGTAPPASTGTAPPASTGTVPTPAPTPAPTATTPTPAPAPTPTPAPTLPYRGVNLAGGEFGGKIPGTEGSDYRFPTNAEVDYYLSKGMTTFRVGFLWERLQPAAYGAFTTAYDDKLSAVVSYATSKGAHVILNPHNFARYYGNTVGSSQVPNAVFADFWSRLSSKWASNPNVMFNLVNEPNTMPTEQWVGAANAAIAAIRTAGAKNVIVVPGNAWTGAHSWYSTGYGTSNAVAMLNVVDPGDNLIFEAHQYLDNDSSGGGGGACISPTIGSERLAPFIKWLRDNHKKGMIGEFAGGANQACNTALTNMLNTMKDASDVLQGWLWWAGGPAWGNYVFTLEPTGGKDAPQMAVLAPFLK
jgi:endoglucanase